MTIEEAIAINLGSIVTGIVAIVTSAITALATFLVSSKNHDRIVEKEKKALLLSKLENTFIELIRWREAITLYMIYVMENIAKENGRFADTEALHKHHNVSLRDISIDPLLLCVTLSVNDEISSKFSVLHRKYINLMEYISEHPQNGSLQEFNGIMDSINANIDVLMRCIEDEIKKTIR
ncbi:hypothetical protein QPK06_19545 [Aeromonas veronii]|uniref:hypothetical protein n=1 Tax=Aeromonas veronii TaxID=654 RepID=UPI00111A063B|nr:hypothetical protein [Aeromonas veronii]MCX0421742.1 hypothetical protein [Aeromonas veronii]TNI73626.1 hypothetical protein CF109_10535 [Aeromonas veronii]WIJ41213.1 hypothetical protein QPK06_19545 [Aeromonas veronii]